MPRPKHGDDDTVVVVEKKSKTSRKKPRLWKVVLHNDDYTTMEFVVAVLTHVFHHSEASATAIMLNIHRTGIGVAGIYTFEVAETKMAETMDLAREAEHPLQVTLEPEDDAKDDEGEDA